MFIELGYYKEFYQNNKFLGSINLDKADREVIGYFGRKTEVLENDITLQGKKYKKGQEVITIMYPLNGKILKPIL